MNKTSLSILAGGLTLLALAILSIVAGYVFPDDWISALDRAGIVLAYLISCISVALAVVGIFRKDEIWLWLSRPRFPGAGAPVIPLKEKVDAIVIPVSRRQQPEWIIRQLAPQRVALLYTEKTRKTAAELARDFEGSMGVFPGSLQIEQGASLLKDPDDSQQARAIVREFIQGFQAAGIPRERIFVDTTGGKVPMSIGAFQAAEELGVSSIYVISQASDPNRPGELFILDPNDSTHGNPRFLSNHSEPQDGGGGS